jgi:two-component system sensor histidine kinase ChvG
VVFTVSDEGPGIPGDKLEAVFERFYSDRPSTDQSHGKNSGLGLSISREIVVAHGGRIYAENVYAPRAAAGAGGTPIGARFTVELPASPTATGRTSPPGGRRAGPAVSQSA